MKIRVSIDIRVGRLVKYFVLSDFFLLAGWGFLDPIFAVFVVATIPGASLITVGWTAAIYWITKSVLQIPVAKYLDRTEGEKDDFITLIGGLVLAGISAMAFGFVRTIAGVYVVQAVHAVAFALYSASWPAIFSRHLDKDRFAFDWSLDSVAIGIASGVTGLLGGIVAAVWGYAAVFIATGLLSFTAALVLLVAPDLILPKPNRGTPPAAPVQKEPQMGV
ncbi:MAG TPA: MFS transporter [Candidatus Paceibacterota bacterium]|nr:MFS transporter [Candidatus Paceibacterota bacterium]